MPIARLGFASQAGIWWQLGGAGFWCHHLSRLWVALILGWIRARNGSKLANRYEPASAISSQSRRSWLGDAVSLDWIVSDRIGCCQQELRNMQLPTQSRFNEDKQDKQEEADGSKRRRWGCDVQQQQRRRQQHRWYNEMIIILRKRLQICSHL